VLFDEAREREAVASAMSGAFASWGYAPVETPVAEEYRTLATGVGGELDRTAFRLIDLDGTLLALRPEMTVPIARMVASRLDEAPGPHRIRYVADVFREHASLRGQARQFRQVGVELIGAAGPAADAEVVLLLVRALEAAGLASFLVGIGNAELLRSLLEQAGGDDAWREALGRALELAAFGAEPRVLDGLRETWEVLETVGVTDRVALDFGIMRSFGYYTGLQLEAYAPGLGLPVAGGGRYDRLLASFGRPAPAAGFALGLERVMIALAEQERTPRTRALDAVLGGADAAAVLAAASRLAAAGWLVRIAAGTTGPDLVREADEFRAAEALVAEDGRIMRVDRAGERAGALPELLPAPPGVTWAAGGGEVR
jgi:ATP phosphoribosyltransferase regulatory subunit